MRFQANVPTGDSEILTSNGFTTRETTKLSVKIFTAVGFSKVFFFFIIIVTTSGNYFHICCFFFPVSASSLSSDISYNLQSWGMFLKLGHKESEWNCNAEIGKHVCGSTSVYNQYFLEIIR